MSMFQQCFSHPDFAPNSPDELITVLRFVCNSLITYLTKDFNYQPSADEKLKSSMSADEPKITANGNGFCPSCHHNINASQLTPLSNAVITIILWLRSCDGCFPYDLCVSLWCYNLEMWVMMVWWRKQWENKGKKCCLSWHRGENFWQIILHILEIVIDDSLMQSQ